MNHADCADDAPLRRGRRAARAVDCTGMTTPAAPAIRTLQANLDRPDHQATVLAMVDAYSRDPMGDGAPLSAEARERLIPGLRAHPTTLVFLAFDGDTPVGVAVCFLGFSTFAAKPLVNLHDVCVVPTHRGRGVGRALLAAVEARARELGCCKLTLEVLDQNHRALRTYTAAGFKRYSLQPGAGEAIFLTKPI
jgi:GNAT superfamily N-acetyltransferase